MAGLNVAEWTPDQVSEWLSGLGPAVAQYVPALHARALDGTKLLTLRCDDLEYLGVHVIGHQELLLEAVDHLRNFQYELSRECIQQLALRVSVVATTLARALRNHTDARLETQTLADVARTVHAVKPLVCWLDRWSPGALAARRAELLQLALEAATSAMRDRFAEQPARAVRAAAAAAAAAAGAILTDSADPAVLAPAALAAVALRPRPRADLGFRVRPSCCGHPQLADIRFGSPAHASGAVHAGDEIVQVGARCVIGWPPARVERACAAAAAAGELALRLRRRAPRPPPAAPRHALRRAPPPAPPDSASDSGSERELSPPASPALHADRSRIYPVKPRAAMARRHTISGGSPVARRPAHTIDQLWQQLRSRARASAGGSPEPEDAALYARDKALSHGTGLAGGAAGAGGAGGAAGAGGAGEAGGAAERARARLDKAHSTPAYDLAGAPAAPPAPPHLPIPESPTTPRDSPAAAACAQKADQILHFRKCSSQIEEAMQQRRADLGDLEGASAGAGAASSVERALETINIAMLEHRRRSLLAGGAGGAGGEPAAHKTTPRYSYQRSMSRAPPPPPRPAPCRLPAPPAPAPVPLPVLRAVPRGQEQEPTSPIKPNRPIDATQISVPLRHLTKHDILMVPTEARDLPAINTEPAPPATPAVPPAAPASPADAKGIALSPTAAVRGIFPTSKSRSLKKKNSILAKRRLVPWLSVAARGAAGAVWQRVRGAGRAAPRWARRQLLLAHSTLYAYRAPGGARAACMIQLAGCTVCAAAEVRSRAHAFKVYHTGSAFYFACASRDDMLAWIQLIHRATLLPALLPHVDVSRQFSETDYSETESDAEGGDRRGDTDKDKDKSKFGSLKRLTSRVQRSDSQESVATPPAPAPAAPAAAASLDRKYLRFFSRHRSKDDSKPKSKQSVVPVPTEHYRSYRRVASPSSPRAPGDPPERPPDPELRASKRIPKPINYIHASNPNLLDFEKSDFVTRPTLQVPAKQKATKAESLAGLVTLEQFMLRKQEEERRQLYSNRVLLGIERDRAALQQRLHRVVPDVIYGEVGAAAAPAPAPAQAAAAPAHKQRRPEPGQGKPISVKGKDGYEKIVYTDDPPEPEDGDGEAVSYDASYGVARDRRPAPPPAPERWRDSLRRNDKVHSAAAAPATPHTHADTWGGGGGGAGGGGEGGGAGGGGAAGGVSRLRLVFAARAQQSVRLFQPPAAQYPHLQCPPTFHPETYSLAHRPRPAPAPAPPGASGRAPPAPLPRPDRG